MDPFAPASPSPFAPDAPDTFAPEPAASESAFAGPAAPGTFAAPAAPESAFAAPAAPGAAPGTFGAPAAPEPGRRGPAGRLVAVTLAAAVAGFAVGFALRSPKPAASRNAISLVPPASIQTVPAPGSISPTPTLSPSAAAGNGAAAPKAAVAAVVDPGIVDIDTQLDFGSGAAAGTGMVISSSGVVLTNNHVVDGSTNIVVTQVTTGRRFKGTVVGTDPTEDVAVVQLANASGLPTVPIGDSNTVRVGDTVVAIGNAGGVGGTPSVASGSVQAIGQTITASDQGGGNPETLNGLIETDVPLQPGDSGGPLANATGKVIGMDTAASGGSRLRASANDSFAIPIAHALDIAHRIQSGQPSATVHIGTPAFLGVSLQPAQSGAAGGEIVSLVAGGPAERAGITVGSVITDIDGQAVAAPPAVSAALKAHHPGDHVNVGWTDPSGNTRSATVTLTNGPAD